MPNFISHIIACSASLRHFPPLSSLITHLYHSINWRVTLISSFLPVAHTLYLKMSVTVARWRILPKAPNNCYGIPRIPSVADLGNCSLSNVCLYYLNILKQFSKVIYKNIWSGASRRTYKSVNLVLRPTQILYFRSYLNCVWWVLEEK